MLLITYCSKVQNRSIVLFLYSYWAHVLCIRSGTFSHTIFCLLFRNFFLLSHYSFILRLHNWVASSCHAVWRHFLKPFSWMWGTVRKPQTNETKELIDHAQVSKQEKWKIYLFTCLRKGANAIKMFSLSKCFRE